MTVVSQPGAAPNNGGTPPSGGEPNSGGTPPANPDPNNGGGQPGGGTPPAVDFTKMSAAEIEKALENPNLWQNPRLKELLEAQKELKTIKEQKATDEENGLKEQSKFKELSEKQAGTIDQLKGTIQTMAQNQALTNELVKAGVVDLDGALKLVDRSKLTTDDNGTVSGVNEALESLKTDRAYLFTNNGNENPNLGGTPPSNGGTPPGGGAPAKFKRSQLKDPEFYKANRDEILKAQQAGLIEDDVTPQR